MQFDVDVDGKKYEVRSSNIAEAAKQAIREHLGATGVKGKKGVTVTVTVKDTPKVRAL